MNTKTFTTKVVLMGSIILSFFVVAISLVEAKTVVRGGETVSIAEEQVIEGDFYSAAGKVNVSGSVEEDIVVAAGQININGPVGVDAFLIGGQIATYGTIGDDLRVISGETTIAEPVMGDVLVVGGSVHILSTASVSGDVVLFVGEATIEGSIGGDIVGKVGNLRIDAPVAGDVDVAVDQLTLGDRSDIEGSVRYVSHDVLVKALNASVAGDVVRSDPVLPGAKPTIYTAFVPVLILLFSILVWYLLSRKSLNTVVSRALTKSPKPLFLGITTLILAPLAGGLLLVSFIGTLVGTAILSSYVLLIVLSAIGLSAVLGQLLMFIFNQSTAGRVTLLSVIVGVIGVALLMLLPMIGQIIFVLLMVITLGAMVDILLKPGKE